LFKSIKNTGLKSNSDTVCRHFLVPATATFIYIKGVNNVMKERIGNIIFLLVITAFAFIYYLDVMSLPHREEKIVVFTLFWLLIVFVSINIVQLFMEYRKSEQDEKIQNKNNKKAHVLKDDKRLILLISLVIYVLLVKIIGFFVTSFLFFIVLSWLLGTRKISTLIFVPSVIVMLTYFFFVKLLNVNIPTGILF